MKTPIKAPTTAATAALAALLKIGSSSMSAAATFIYVSRATSSGCPLSRIKRGKFAGLGIKTRRSSYP
jgi:hypothetical protein